MPARYLLAIDQGTTSSRAIVFDKKLKAVGQAGVEFKQYFPKPGWVEHDLNEIWSSTEKSIAGALKKAGVSGKEIAAIGITNQRETTAIWDRKTSKPIHPAIVWQCRRTAAMCDALKKAGHEKAVRERTGLVLDAYFSGTKIRWLLDNVKGAEARAKKGELAFGTIDSWLLWKLSSGKTHATDVTNASRTLLMDLAKREWDGEMLQLFGVPRELLPKIGPSAGELGVTAGLKILPDGIPVAGIAGDQQAALFGQACFTAGEAKCTYGTGAFLLMNAGHQAPTSKHGLLATAAWQLGDEATYALEGSAFIAGAAVQWLRDGLGMIERSSEIEALARSVPDSNGVVFVPALAGLGAPHWRQDARGLIAGLDRGTTAAHLARATLEGIAFQIYDLVAAMAQDIGHEMPMFRVDGGASQNDLLMQFQADLLQAPIERPKMVETTALGAAMLAGLGTGLFKSTAELKSAVRGGKKFTAKMKPELRAQHLARWNAAVAKA